jgi:hypothetical protein
MVISHYYAGISSTPPFWDNSTQDCVAFLEQHVDVYDVKALQPLEEEAMAVIEGLHLQVSLNLFVFFASMLCCVQNLRQNVSRIHFIFGADLGHVLKKKMMMMMMMMMMMTMTMTTRTVMIIIH